MNLRTRARRCTATCCGLSSVSTNAAVFDSPRAPIMYAGTRKIRATCAICSSRDAVISIDAASADDEPPNACAAGDTRGPLALIHGKPLLHRPVAIGSRVVVDRSAARLHRLAQDAHDRGVESLNLLAAQSCAGGERMEVRSPERLVGIDIPNAGDAALIEQCPLQAAGVSREDRPKQIRSEVRRKRFGAIVEKAWTITRVEACCGYAIIAASNQGEAAECPHIAVTQVAPVAGTRTCSKADSPC